MRFWLTRSALSTKRSTSRTSRRLERREGKYPCGGRDKATTNYASRGLRRITRIATQYEEERSGWLAPSSAFRLTCREKPISVRNLHTLLGLIEWPMVASADASLSMLIDTAADASDRPMLPVRRGA